MKDNTTRACALKHHERTERIIQATGLSGTQKAVLHALSHRTNQHGEAWPEQGRLARESGLSVRGLRKVVRSLEVLGLISTDAEARRSVTYRIQWDALSEMAAPEQSTAPRNVVPPDPEQSAGQPEQGSASTGTGFRQTVQERIRNESRTETSTGVKSDEKSTPVEEAVDKLRDLWEQMEDVRAEHKRGSRRRQLLPARRSELRARVRETSADDVMLVCRWLWTSKHHRAVYIRENDHEGAMLRPKKFPDYLDLARMEAESASEQAKPWEKPARPPQPVLIDCPDAAAMAAEALAGHFDRIRQAGGGLAELREFLSWRCTDPDAVLAAGGER